MNYVNKRRGYPGRYGYNNSGSFGPAGASSEATLDTLALMGEAPSGEEWTMEYFVGLWVQWDGEAMGMGDLVVDVVEDSVLLGEGVSDDITTTEFQKHEKEKDKSLHTKYLRKYIFSTRSSRWSTVPWDTSNIYTNSPLQILFLLELFELLSSHEKCLNTISKRWSCTYVGNPFNWSRLQAVIYHIEPYTSYNPYLILDINRLQMVDHIIRILFNFVPQQTVRAASGVF